MAEAKRDLKTGLSKPENKAPGAKQDETSTGRGPIAWLMGWVVLPSLVFAGIFGGGVLFGVHLYDAWLTRAVVWVGDLFFA